MDLLERLCESEVPRHRIDIHSRKRFHQVPPCFDCDWSNHSNDILPIRKAMRNPIYLPSIAVSACLMSHCRSLMSSNPRHNLTRFFLIPMFSFSSSFSEA